MSNTNRSTGSLINHLAGNSAQIAPVVGMGATRLCWTDRLACTIVEIANDKTGAPVRIVVQEDTATRIDENGMSDAQAYSYEANPEGSRHTYTRRKNGAWIADGESMKDGERLLIGQRMHYFDYSY